MKRNSNFELLRIFCMILLFLGICLARELDWTIYPCLIRYLLILLVVFRE